MARERDKQPSVHSFQQEVVVEGVKWEQPGSWKQFRGRGEWGEREVPETAGKPWKGSRKEHEGEVSRVPVLIWESESWEDKFERLLLGVQGAGRERRSQRGPGLVGAGGQWAGRAVA